jgi:hypothetical protein
MEIPFYQKKCKNWEGNPSDQPEDVVRGRGRSEQNGAYVVNQHGNDGNGFQ